MSIFENFKPNKFKSVEDMEREEAERMKPMDDETFKKVAGKLEEDAKKAGFEAVGQLPPEPFPVKGEEQEDIAA